MSLLRALVRLRGWVSLCVCVFGDHSALQTHGTDGNFVS